MHFLACTVLACCVGQAKADNLDLRRGFDGWQGDGFTLTAGPPAGVHSRDEAGTPRKAKITYRFTVPAAASAFEARAARTLGKGCTPDHRLDLVLLLPDAGNKLVPKTVRTGTGWSSGTGEQAAYRWDLTPYRGQAVQIILRDLDDRPGCHVEASDLKLLHESAAATVAPEGDDSFARFMLDLQDKHKLLTMARYDTRRFTAISNAREELTREHLKHYEQFYDLFLDHFRRRGFTVSAPKGRLMVAAFDTPAGFNAYFGQPFAPAIAGIYHPATNRLVIYDLGRLKEAEAYRDSGLKASQSGKLALRAESVERRWREAVSDANLGTALHECAHQLAFNCGLLNRQGHVPVWLAEGLACYCEATDQGDRQIIGAPNRRRIETLAQAKERYLPLDDLLREDNLLRSSRALLGYAQSWALFRMLMEQEPAAMRSYLARLQTRQTSEHRMADFQAAFGDVPDLERRYRAYLGNLVRQ